MSAGITPTTRAHAEYMASGFECISIASDPTHLLLDFDEERLTQAQAQYLDIIALLQVIPGLNARETARWTSRSGKGRHVVVEVDKPLSKLERLLLQCCLGSDPRRELFGLARLPDTPADEEVSYLFRPEHA